MHRLKHLFLFALLALLCLSSCDVSEEDLEACSGQSLEQLAEQKDISEECKEAIQDLLPSPSSNLINSLEAFGSGIIENRNVLFFTGSDQDGSAIDFSNFSNIQVSAHSDTLDSLLDTTGYLVKRLSDYEGQIVSFSSIIDYSGSMSGQDIEDAIEIFTDLYNVLGNVTGFESNIIFFSDSVKIQLDFTDETEQLINHIQLDPDFERSYTALFDAMATGADALAERIAPVKFLIVATDGGENGSQIITETEQLYTKLRSAGTPVIILGALFSDLDFMEEAVNQVGGYYIYSKSLLALKEDFIELREIIVNIIAVELLNPSPDWDLIRINYGSNEISFDL